MKRIIPLASIIFLFATVNAQFPKTFDFQGIAQNDDGTPLSNTVICVEVTILQGSDCENNPQNCNIVWQELHFPQTNDFGFFDLKIGDGQSTYAGSATTFDSINFNDFSNGNYFLRIRTDFGNSATGNAMTDLGTVMFQSVPYSLTAANINRTNGKVPINLTELQDISINSPTVNQILAWNGTTWTNAPPTAAGASTLNDLNDVSINSPDTGQVLIFDGLLWANAFLPLEKLSNTTISNPTNGQLIIFSDGQWHNSFLSLENLYDTDTSGILQNDILTWNGTKWTNQHPIWQQNDTVIFYDKQKKLGVFTDSAKTSVNIQLSDNNGFMISGEFSNSAKIDDLGKGTKLFYYPAKSVFRCGTTSSDQWDDASSGEYSFGFGNDVIASAIYSVSFGYNNNSVGNFSVTFGSDNTAQGAYAFVTGTNNKAPGGYSFVTGANNNTSLTSGGTGAITSGTGNTGGGDNSLTVGTSNTNYSDNGIVFGNYCGANTALAGQNSMAGGTGVKANADNSVAFGYYTNSSAYASLVIGRYNTQSGNATSWQDADPLLVAGNGTSATARNNAAVLYKNGNLAIEGTLSESVSNPSKNTQQFDYQNITKLNLYSSQKKDGTIKPTFAPDEVKLLYPSAIRYFNGNYAISYSFFIPLMNEMIKNQQKQIDSLKQQNTELKNRLDKLETLLKNKN